MDPVLHMGPTKQRILERRQLSKLLVQRCQMTETTLIQTIKSKEFPLHINESPAVKNILFKKKLNHWKVMLGITLLVLSGNIQTTGDKIVCVVEENQETNKTLYKQGLCLCSALTGICKGFDTKSLF